MIMDLPSIWFVAVATLWIGYFILEGFDFGVGICLALIGKDERRRHAILSTITPVWDGNEVWVIVAAGAMFAAFPGWYATTFSAFYLPLVIILLGLIIRAVAFEYREHRHDRRWQRRWDRCIIAGSVLPAAGWGLVFANLVRGLPIGVDHEFTGSLLDLLSPFALLGGLVTFALFLTHGAVFLTLRTTGELRARAKRLAGLAGVITVLLAAGFLLTLNRLPDVGHPYAVGLLSLATVAALVLGLVMLRRDRDGGSFVGTTASVAGVVITIYTALYPRLLPSTSNPSWSLTISNSSATDYTLTIMSWSAVVLLPLVIGYQAWTYWVFRKRITMPAVTSPGDPS
jgi:cytochrome d ubiquinol oxidase subunit II